MKKVALAVLFASLLSQPAFAGTCAVYVVDSRGKPQHSVNVAGWAKGQYTTGRTNWKGLAEMKWRGSHGLDKIEIDKAFVGRCQDGGSITIAIK